MYFSVNPLSFHPVSLQSQMVIMILIFLAEKCGH